MLQSIENLGFGIAKRDELHLARKIWHVAWGLGGLILYYKSGKTVDVFIRGCLAIAALGFFLDYLRMKLPSFNKFAFKAMGTFFRESEKNTYSGLPYYALGVALSLMFFEEKLALLSIFFLVFADPLSSIIGILFGKKKIVPNKSWAGSSTGFIVCTTISLLYISYFNESAPQLVLFSLIAGFIGSFSEFASTWGLDDNLTIPVLSGAGLSILNYFIPVLF